MKTRPRSMMLACAGVLLLAGLTVPTAALGQAATENTVELLDVPVGAHIYNSCTGEWIDVSGALRYQYHLTQTPSGRLIESMVFQAGHLEGYVPATGEDYEVNLTDLSVGVLDQSYTGQQGYVYQYSARLIQHGSGVVAVFKGTFTYRINANGEFVVENAEDTIDCEQ